MMMILLQNVQEPMKIFARLSGDDDKSLADYVIPNKATLDLSVDMGSKMKIYQTIDW